MTTLTQAVTSFEAQLSEVVETFTSANDLAETKASQANASAITAFDKAAEALTSKNAASASAANALTSENAASGQADLATNAAATTQTLRDSIIATQGAIGYLPPVAYAAGLVITLPAQTVSYSGQAYAPLLPALPFTTSGTFETAKFRLIQGVAGVDLAAAGGALGIGYQHSVGVDATNLQEAARAELVNVNLFFISGESSSKSMFVRATAAARRVFVPAGIYTLDAQLNIPSNTEIFGVGDASVIQIMSGAYSGFVGSGVSGVKIRNVKFVYPNSTGSTAYKGAVIAYNCNNFLISGVTVSNASYWAICLWNTSNSEVSNCVIEGNFSTIQDNCDIALRSNCNFNRILNNRCNGAGADHGILIQDPYDGSTPTGNVIKGNYVSEHKSYGIAVYVTTTYNTKTSISKNHVYDVLGTALGGSSGNGIYAPGASGLQITGNHVWNCMRQSTIFGTLAIGAIGVSSTNGGAWPVIISENIIHSTRGPGIATLSTTGPVTVSNNSVTVENSVVGEAGHCFNGSNCSGLKLVGNKMIHASTTHQVVRLTAINALLTDIDISGNDVSATYIGIYIAPTGTGSFESLRICGNSVKGGTATALHIQKGNEFIVGNNILKSSGGTYNQTDVTNARLTANSMSSTSTGNAYTFNGINTGTVADESNRMSGGLINNSAGNGAILARYGVAAGGQLSGTHGIGDRVIQSVPVVGNPKGWRCTVGGNPGTWVSEGVL